MLVTNAAAITMVKLPIGRWIIVLTAARDWAWSGRRFTDHKDGVGKGAQICTFATETEAIEYALEHVIVKPKKEEK